MASRCFAPLFFVALLSACSANAPPDTTARIKKEYRVEICEGSKVAIIYDLLTLANTTTYQISFPNSQCVNKFLQSLVADSTYEHPFDDESKLLGSSDKKHMLFSTVRSGKVVIFRVTRTAEMNQKFESS
ncbi:hypothetical protein [Sphingopyxis sp. JAI128]|uniref:hypothetical protein n=1 Tax=Sphingopyxis sp. JAI128 TaxID=2723066 RepID=UPI0016215327|nr:hypothetical protein [Sphingopyxis sp. JAI128]MBB6427359.1 hypothetical protein [Sphingopyxis sp. JAI128]